jgi:hypothetical protein
MTAAKVNLKEGKKVPIGSFLSGNISFSSGSYCNICTIYKRTSQVIIVVVEFGFVIFALLTVYFLLIAKKPKKKRNN